MIFGRIMLVVSLCLLVACPAAQDEAPISEVCTKTGAKCKLKPGQLGVCMMEANGAFYCASQH